MLLVSTLPDESSSITVAGGTRPPNPMTVGGIAGPGPAETTVGVTISVVVRFANPLEVGRQLGVQPGRNSCTRPLTVIDAPTATPGAEPVKTKMPSDVATRVRLRILEPEPVRGHGRDDTGHLRDEVSVEGREVRRALDLVDAQRKARRREAEREVACHVVGRVDLVDVGDCGRLDHDRARLVLLQVALGIEDERRRGPARRDRQRTFPLVVHSIANAPVPAVMGSLKVMVTFEFVGTSVAPLGGVVAATNGAVSAEQECVGVSAVRGLGVVAAKSAALSPSPGSRRRRGSPRSCS